MDKMCDDPNAEIQQRTRSDDTPETVRFDERPMHKSELDRRSGPNVSLLTAGTLRAMSIIDDPSHPQKFFEVLF